MAPRQTRNRKKRKRARDFRRRALLKKRGEEWAGEDWEAKLDAIVRNSGIPVEYDARPGHERYSRGVAHVSPRPPSRFHDRYFQSATNCLKRLLESVHAGSVANIEDAVNLRHVPTKPPPKFSFCDSLLLHRVVQFDLWHRQWWNIDL